MSSRAKKKALNGGGKPPVAEEKKKEKSKAKKAFVVVALILAGLLILALLADLLISWILIDSWITPEKTGWTQSPSEVALWSETFELDTPNGKIYGWIMAAQEPLDEEAEDWVAPEGYSDKTVVFSPNYDSTREMLDMGGVEYFVDFCKEGYNVITFDWTGSGFSEGEENAFLLDKTEELKAVIDYAQRETEADFLAVQGIGFGCYPAARATAEHKEVDALILDSCYDKFSDVLFTRFENWAGDYNLAPIQTTVEWLFPVMTDVEVSSVSLSEQIGSIHGKSLFFIQGGADDIFGTEDVKKLSALAATDSTNRVSSWILPGVGHLRARSYDSETYFTRIAAFLKEASEPAA